MRKPRYVSLSVLELGLIAALPAADYTRHAGPDPRFGNQPRQSPFLRAQDIDNFDFSAARRSDITDTIGLEIPDRVPQRV
jgi:hypothetical protein